jgi:hypothetical protein
MSPRPPQGKKPGAGLGHLFPTEEPKTAKVPTVASEPDPTILCPACNGELHVLDGENPASSCPICHATGSVPQDVFDTYVEAHPNCAAARQLAAKRGTAI